jgi:hypothetical protein
MRLAVQCHVLNLARVKGIPNLQHHFISYSGHVVCPFLIFASALPCLARTNRARVSLRFQPLTEWLCTASSLYLR